MPRPFRLFSAYDFFSVFVPGLATTFALYFLIPGDIDISLTAALIPTLLLAFIFGQALHAFADFIHAQIAKSDCIDSHREKFAKEIVNPDAENEITVGKFKQEIFQFIDDPRMRERMQDGSKLDQWEALYPIVQSQVYNYGQGRSINFQAIYAFSRSMLLLLFGLPIVFTVHYGAQSIGLFQRDPFYMEFFPTYFRLMQAAVPLCIIGGILFLISTRSYQKNFVKYLISDFIVIREDEKGSTAPVRR